MKTRIIHNKLAKYNLNSQDLSESYVFFFDETDKENKTIRFTYDEETAPQLHISDYTVLELIEELEYISSKKYLYNSSYNSIEEKPHSDRITLAKQLALKNKLEDNKALVKKLQKEILRLQDRITEIWQK